MKIKVGVSNHHIHVTRETLDILFGKGYELHNKRDLVQKGQFAAEETVTLECNGKQLEHIRIIGPCRPYTQVELLERDNEYFGIHAPVRTSGDLEGSENITIIGPNGIVFARESTIVADRHIHMSAEDLVTFNQKAKNIVTIKCENGVVMDNVHIKSDETCVLEYHMNKDEAEDLGIETGMKIEII
jgi:putative phosphotransacetylase